MCPSPTSGKSGRNKPRTVIHVHGLEHVSPIPVGVRTGNMVFSSAITGKHLTTGERPADAATQIRYAFQNLRVFLEAAGATADDVSHVRMYLADLADRAYVNTEWEQMFPDPEDRPARHAVLAPLDEFHEGMRIQLEIVAVLDAE